MNPGGSSNSTHSMVNMAILELASCPIPPASVTFLSAFVVRWHDHDKIGSSQINEATRLNSLFQSLLKGTI
jgi:hypothetical protein